MNILTFDIEDWFHILDEDSTKTEKEWNNYESRLEKNMDKIFELLERKNQHATFFCLGWVAQKHPNIIRKIAHYGYEIASHSSMHQLVYEQSMQQFTQDVEASVKGIEDITGKKVSTYRAPGFSITENCQWAFEVLLKNGINVDSSVFPAVRGHGGFESFGTAQPVLINVNGMLLKEFPINVYSLLGKKIIFSGGGYFRLFPYWFLQYAMKHADYVMTYFHPRDFDAQQPMLKNLPLIRKFKSYYGLKDAFAKLERIITDFNFIDIQEANEKIDWDNAKVLKINPL